IRATLNWPRIGPICLLHLQTLHKVTTYFLCIVYESETCNLYLVLKVTTRECRVTLKWIHSGPIFS
ncbi:hypothetical protein SK128_020533, partial [Halocaridina rubra]